MIGPRSADVDDIAAMVQPTAIGLDTLGGGQLTIVLHLSGTEACLLASKAFTHLGDPRTLTLDELRALLTPRPR